MIRYLLSVTGLLLLIGGCHSRQRLLSKREFLKYINDPGHGLVQKTKIKDVDVQLSYEPSSLLVAQELSAAGRGDTATLHNLEKKYSGNYYFLLKFSKNNKELIRQLGSFSQYSDMVQVLSFQMQQFVNLTTAAHDTVEMSDYAFEQTYGMGNANTVLLAFPKEKIVKANRLDVNLAECGFGIGSMKFDFEKKDLDQIPRLDYNRLD
jgi:hypothetical protein